MAIAQVQQAIEAKRQILLNHPTYPKIKSIEHLQIFMQQHVYAVWDFMSLLKALQQQLTCVDVPWKAVGDANIRHFINEIVLGEECDLNWDGNMQSHYEMYLSAMQLAGANVSEIESFVDGLSDLESVFTAINNIENEAVKDFLHFTFSLIKEGKAHKIAAAFTFGREDLIPGMFTGIVDGLKVKAGNQGLSAFDYYLKRHIELDGDEHGPLALQLIENLCQNSDVKWKEVEETSLKALEIRIALWDNIGESISTPLSV